MSVGATSAAGAMAAAAHQEMMRKEEEDLTRYDSKDLEKWEFKIVRSSGKINGEKFRQLCEEESKNGWELLEKFDDHRVRFKRQIERREQDSYTEIDPYRTHFGMSEGKLVFIILGVVFVFVAAIVAVLLLVAP